MKRSTIFALSSIVAGLTSYVVMKPAIADAAHVKLHASTCHVESGVLQSNTEGQNGLWSTSGSLVAYCPFPERDFFTRTAVTSISVFGSREDNPFIPGDVTLVKVCRSFATVDGGECGAAATAAGTTSFQLIPTDLGAWPNTAGYPYVYSFAEGRNLKLRGLLFQ
jgi:hypothetical protein